MRESEFCIPTSNKAVISITPNWYDRRALDTRSNYALYSSLSHLAILCQTSPKVRESLACDGGLERIVRILKQGKLCRTPEMFQLSKWQQALLCAVNIGVRGSETIRNRVIEAGIVPILVTILCNALEDIINYDRASAMTRKQTTVDFKHHHAGQNNAMMDRFRGRVEPAVPISNPQAIMNVPSIPQQAHRPGMQLRARPISARTSTNHEDTVALQRHAVRSRQSSDASYRSLPVERLTAETNDLALDNNLSSRDSNSSIALSGEADTGRTSETERIATLADRSLETLSLEEGRDQGQRNLEAERSLPASDGTTRAISGRRISSEAPDAALPSQSSMPSSPVLARVSAPSSDNHPTSLNRNVLMAPTTRPPTTWDQDVTLCLRLLAYLSKYPYLRPDFCKSHDVPQLRQNLKQFEIHYHSHVHGVFEQMDDDLSDSLQIPFNVFHLVEKFTMRIHAHESTYWAGVIMRNSCRRHETGGIRQCAYLECGKWETQNREFAKCRRCRRTKYCSKACQSKAWVGHRYWCSSSTSPEELL